MLSVLYLPQAIDLFKCFILQVIRVRIAAVKVVNSEEKKTSVNIALVQTFLTRFDFKRIE